MSERSRPGVPASSEPLRALADELRAVLGSGSVVTDPELVAGYETDWTGRFRGRPGLVVRPEDLAGTAEVVRRCRAAGIPVVTQGGNTSLVGGAVPVPGCVVLSTRRMDRITDIDRSRGALTAGAGTTVARVHLAAQDAGWRYGVDFAARETATVGGTVATNAGGHRVLRHGDTRRQLLGVQAVLGNGDVVDHLRGLGKDNTGYSLEGLLCGSEGTLGVVTAARLALVAPAGPTTTVLLGCSSVADALDALAQVRRRGAPLEAAELMLADGVALVEDQLGLAPVVSPSWPVLALFEAVGPPDPTPALADALGGRGEMAVATDAARAAQLWLRRDHHSEALGRLDSANPPAHTPVHKYDVTLDGADLERFVDDVRAAVPVADPAARCWVFGHLGDGNLHVNVTGWRDDTRALDEVVLSRVIGLHGSIDAEHGIGRAKREWLHRDRAAGDVAAMVAIKAALDPDGILNPGVLLPPSDDH